MGEIELMEMVVEEIIRRLFPTAEGETKKELMADLYEPLNERVNNIMIDAMPPHSLDKLAELIGERDMAKVTAFCFATVPGLRDTVRDAVMGFRTEYLTKGPATLAELAEEMAAEETPPSPPPPAPPPPPPPAAPEVPTIETFVERLAAQKFPGEDPDVLAELKRDMAASVERIMNRTILEHMPESTLPDFERVLDTGSEADMVAFCRQNVPDFNNVVLGVLKRYSETFGA